MRRLSRRQFGRLVLGSFAFSLLSNCSPGQSTRVARPVGTPPDLPGTLATAPSPTPIMTSTLAAGPPAVPATIPVASATGLSKATATETMTAMPTATPSPSPTSASQILRNDNVPGFYVRYYKPFEAIDPTRWRLKVDGLVMKSQELTLAEVFSLERVSQTSRMKCVECWSSAAKWEGFHLRSLLRAVNPHPDAAWVHFHCADGYYESLSIEALLEERVLFAHHMNDRILPHIYGTPLRLMIPSLYGYKSAKAIIRMEFAKYEMSGYWPDTGPYTTHGVIRQGSDHPIDLEDGSRKIRGGGEIFYPDGIESAGQGGM